MKKLFTLILFLLVFSSNAQIIGMQVGACFTHGDFFGPRGWGPTIGVFYNQKLFRGVEISTGFYDSFWAEKGKFEGAWGFADCPYPPRYKETTQIMEIPVELRLRLSPYEDGKLKFFLIGGYGCGYVSSCSQTYYFNDGKRNDVSVNYSDNNGIQNIGRIGYEWQYKPSEIFLFILGTQYKYRIFNNQIINNWNAYFKLGYNLKSKKK